MYTPTKFDILEAHILRLEGCDNFNFRFWQFLANLNKCAKFYLNLSRCLPNLQKNWLSSNDTFVDDISCL
jgi:hypothetical protein